MKACIIRSRFGNGRMIDKFLGRTLVYNAQMIKTANRHGFIFVDVLQSNVAELTKRCLSILGIVGNKLHFL